MGYLKTNCAGGVIEMDEIEEVVEGIFRFAGITVIMLDSYNSLMAVFFT